MKHSQCDCHKCQEEAKFICPQCGSNGVDKDHASLDQQGIMFDWSLCDKCDWDGFTTKQKEDYEERKAEATRKKYQKRPGFFDRIHVYYGPEWDSTKPGSEE